MMMEVPQYVEVTPTSNVVECGQGVVLTQEEEEMLMKIAQAEGGTEGPDGMALIMKVVLNRVKSDKYPNTIYEVISQKGQFESFRNGSYETAVPSEDCELALAYIESGMFAKDTVIAFEIAGNRTLGRYFFYAFTYRGHDFYTEK